MNMEDDSLLDTVAHFENRANKTIHLEKLIESEDYLAAVDRSDIEQVENRARKFISVAKARYAAGGISEHELLFYICHCVENQVHETRCSNGIYDKDLRSVNEAIKEVERKYDLKDGEYWRLDDAPDEYLKLNAIYDSVLQQKLVETFIEFDSPDLALLYTDNPDKFNESRKIGYRSVFKKDEHSRLISLANMYEREASHSANGEAFFAASVMLTSAIETRLIIACLNNKQAVTDALNLLGLSNSALKSKNPLRWTLETLIEVCNCAGWLPKFETDNFVYDRHAMATFLRSFRNNVHPAVHLKQKSGLSFGKEQYKDVFHIHKALIHSLPTRIRHDV
ncbi:hypothetical protein ACHELR_000322 [Vibrio fluvialis]